jgi:hypothetical protein
MMKTGAGTLAWKQETSQEFRPIYVEMMASREKQGKPREVDRFGDTTAMLMGGM